MGEPFSYRFEQYSSGAFGDDISWSSRDEVLAEYRRIFRRYRLFRRNRIGRMMLQVLSRLTRSEFGPGWYDTHAARPLVLEDRPSEESP